MKKNLMTLAVAGAVAASAQAQMYVNPDNTGEVLIYPFYSADNGNQTYIHVVNTTDLYKAAKVRILEAENSQEVRDFNLYLSPKDHFSFAISLDESGAGKLETSDTSCTVPAIPAGGVEFTNMLFAKDENASLERTLNGYVEIIEMGQFKGTATTDPGYMWKHVSGTPRNCPGVVDLWASDGDWFAERLNNGDRGITGRLSAWTGGGLYGMGIIVNPEAGAAVGYDAVAIDDFVDALDANAAAARDAAGAAEAVGMAGASLHYYPGSTNPGLNGKIGITENTATVFNDGDATTYTFTGTTIEGNPVQNAVTSTLNAVSGLIMASKVSNDYVLDPFFDGATDWVVTFPTKRLYVRADTNTASPLANDPFWREWDGDEACDPYRITLWDREEDTFTPDADQPPFSPYLPEENFDPKLCYEANILTYTPAGTDPRSPLLGEEPSASGARIQTKVETAYDNGWAELSFNRADLFAASDTPASVHSLPATETDGTAVTMFGLPAVGFSVIRFGNDSVQGGVLANYAAAHEHKMTRLTSVASE